MEHTTRGEHYVGRQLVHVDGVDDASAYMSLCETWPFVLFHIFEILATDEVT